MRISDWSSDVCSSDLRVDHRQQRGRQLHAVDAAHPARGGEAGQVADHAAAECVHASVAGGAECGQRADGVAEACEGLLRSEEHTSELQSLKRTSYAVFCLQKKKRDTRIDIHTQ